MREFKTVQSTAYLIRHALSTLISVSPSSLGVIFFEGVLKLRIRLPGCRVDIKEIAARWQELSFNQHSPFVLLIYLDLKQNSPWCKTKVREFTTDHRTVRVIRAYSLISPAPSLQESFFSCKELWHSASGLPDAGLILKKMPLVGKSFLLINTPFVLPIYLDLKQNSPW